MANDVECLTDLPYGNAAGYLLFLDLYRPEPLPSQALPVVMYIHGGMWRRGDKALSSDPFLAQTGRYMVASINYRRSDQAIFPAQLHDAKAAVRWLRANAQRLGIDPQRIGVWGHDAGGHLASLLGVTGTEASLEGNNGSPEQPSHVQAVVAVAAPSDLSQLGDWHDEPDSPESLLVGGALPTRPELVQQANPLNYLNQPAPPFLLIHGEQDQTVPVGQSLMLQQALQAANAEVELLLLPEAEHNFGANSPYLQQINQQILAFFDRVLQA